MTAISRVIQAPTKYASRRWQSERLAGGIQADTTPPAQRCPGSAASPGDLNVPRSFRHSLTDGHRAERQWVDRQRQDGLSVAHGRKLVLHQLPGRHRYEHHHRQLGSERVRVVHQRHLQHGRPGRVHQLPVGHLY